MLNGTRAPRRLEDLMARRWDTVEILITYLDEMQFGAHRVVSAVGVEVHMRKHLLGLQRGATKTPRP